MRTFFFYCFLLLLAGGTRPATAQAIDWERTLGGSSADGLGGVNTFTAIPPIQIGVAPHGGWWAAAESSSPPGSGERTAPRRAMPNRTDFWLLRLDARGQPRWDRAFGGLLLGTGTASAQNKFTTLCPTADGGCLLAGTSNAGANGDKSEPSHGDYDCWLIKLDSLGTKQWDRSLGGSGYDAAMRVRQLPDGGYLVAAISTSPADGDKAQPSSWHGNVWLVRLDRLGRKRWDVTRGSPGGEAVLELLPTRDGGCLLACESEAPAGGDKTEPGRGGDDFWLLKPDSLGNKQWDRTLGGTGAYARPGPGAT